MQDAASNRSVERAVQAVRQVWGAVPQAGIVLGSGLGSFAGEISAEAVFSYGDLPGFSPTTAIGHSGRLVCGTLDSIPIVAMEGRCHLYEGYSWDDVTFPVRVLRQLGVQFLILSNASGGVNPRIGRGDLVVIRSHINLLGPRGRPVLSGTETGSVYDARHSAPYDSALATIALDLAPSLNVVAVPGVYVAMLGPNYETRAEYRLARKIGGDVVGMSTVPEAIVGHECGMRVLAISVITNVARPDAPHRTTGQEVVEAAEAAEAGLSRLVRNLIGTVVTTPPHPA